MSVTIRAGRRDVEISRPDKPLFGDDITKADLARYYEQVSSAMLPHLADRPLNLERYPDGIGGHRIIQQHASAHFPAWIGRVRVPKAGGTVEHVLARDGATLVYLANQACITFHSWLSRKDRLDRPDRVIFDLDPSREDLEAMARAARVIGEILRELELEPFVMTSGSRGYHVLVPLQRRADHDTVREFARGVGELAEAREPKLFTLEQRKAKRNGRILIDIMRNGYAHTAVAPYSVRPRPGAPVATPLHWEELSDSCARPDGFTLAKVPDRLDRDGDPWRDLAKHVQPLAGARRRLERALSAQR